MRGLPLNCWSIQLHVCLLILAQQCIPCGRTLPAASHMPCEITWMGTLNEAIVALNVDESVIQNPRHFRFRGLFVGSQQRLPLWVLWERETGISPTSRDFRDVAGSYACVEIMGFEISFATQFP